MLDGIKGQFAQHCTVLLGVRRLFKLFAKMVLRVLAKIIQINFYNVREYFCDTQCSSQCRVLHIIKQNC